SRACGRAGRVAKDAGSGGQKGKAMNSDDQLAVELAALASVEPSAECQKRVIAAATRTMQRARRRRWQSVGEIATAGVASLVYLGWALSTVFARIPSGP